MDNRKKVGYARTAIGLIVITGCVYLLLNNTASAATVVESVSQILMDTFR
ncbi:MAG: hypothetical protein V3V22_06310 [Methylococcales bacterium]